MFRFHGGSRPSSRAAIGTALVLATTAATPAVLATAAQAAPVAAVATASAPAAPKGLKAEYVNWKQGFQLTWQADTDAATTGYRVYRWRTGDGPDAARMLGTVDKAASPSYTDTTEIESGGVHYSYAVTTVGKDGRETRRSTPVDVVRPWHAAPVDVSATLKGSLLHMEWTQPEVGDRPDHWMIYRSKTAPVRLETGAELVHEAGGRSDDIELTGEGNEDYYYAVVAVAPALSPFSESVKPDYTPGPINRGTPPPAPVWMGGHEGKTRIGFSWAPIDPPAGEPRIVGYNVYRSLSRDMTMENSTKLNPELLTNNSYGDGPAPGATYYYAVTAVNAAGAESKFSMTIPYTPGA
ncbi:hypothetical protein [Streptomyces sp. NPDC001678]|uniref:hypothetical protein n=1 Tax=Streptomyces sp. NPDC001678 TaxID=3364599 RepID=UPI0036A3B34B